MKQANVILILLVWAIFLCVACRPKPETVEVTRIVTETIIETVEVTPTVHNLPEAEPENDLGEVAEQTVTPVTATPRPTETISFAPGTNFTRVVGALPSHSQQSYVLTAQQGQEIEVVIVAPPIEGVTLAVFHSDGSPLQTSDAGSLSYRGTLAQSGDIILTVVSRDNPVPYGVDVTLTTPTQVVEQAPTATGGAPTVTPGSEPITSTGGGGGSAAVNQETSDVVNWGTFEGAPAETFLSFGGGGGGPPLTSHCERLDAGGMLFVTVSPVYDGTGNYEIHAIGCNLNSADLSVAITTPDQRVIPDQELTVPDPNSPHLHKVYEVELSELEDNEPFNVTFTSTVSGEIVEQLEARFYTIPSLSVPSAKTPDSWNHRPPGRIVFDSDLSAPSPNIIELWAFAPKETVRVVIFGVTPFTHSMEVIAWMDIQVDDNGESKIELPLDMLFPEWMEDSYTDLGLTKPFLVIDALRENGQQIEPFLNFWTQRIVESAIRLPYLFNFRVMESTPTAVTLTWEAGPEPLENYRWEVLRSETPGGPFELVGLAESPCCFEDGTVTSGLSYYYTVRTVDLAGNVLANSRELMVAISAEGEATSDALNTVILKVRVPENSTGGGPVAISGDLIQLHPDNPLMSTRELNQIDDLYWAFTFSGVSPGELYYRYELGSWEYPERGADCEEIPVRFVDLNFTENSTIFIEDTVLNWQNVSPCGAPGSE